jgi:hypothetical protein
MQREWFLKQSCFAKKQHFYFLCWRIVKVQSCFSFDFESNFPFESPPQIYNSITNFTFIMQMFFLFSKMKLTSSHCHLLCIHVNFSHFLITNFQIVRYEVLHASNLCAFFIGDFITFHNLVHMFNSCPLILIFSMQNTSWWKE